MSEEEKFFDSLLENKLEDLHTAILVKVVEYDPELQKVNVKPILKKMDGEEYPMILNVPIAIPNTEKFYITMPYKKGDWGFVVFSERDFEDSIYSGDEQEIGHTRKHDITDAVFIGGIKPFSEELEHSNDEDIVIAHKEKKCKIFIKENAEIEVETEGEINVEADGDVHVHSNAETFVTASDKVYLGGTGADEGIALGDTLKEWLDSHVHEGVESGSGTSGTPTSDSPDTSDKVVTE